MIQGTEIEQNRKALYARPGPANFVWSGSVPGMSIANAQNGQMGVLQIYGTPTTVGTYTIKITDPTNGAVTNVVVEVQSNSTGPTEIGIYYGQSISGNNISSPTQIYTGVDSSNNTAKTYAYDFSQTYYVKAGASVFFTCNPMAVNPVAVSSGSGLTIGSDMSNSFVSGQLLPGTHTISWSNYNGSETYTTTFIVIGDGVVYATDLTLQVVAGGSSARIDGVISPSNVSSNGVNYTLDTTNSNIHLGRGINDSPTQCSVSYDTNSSNGIIAMVPAQISGVTADGKVRRTVTVYPHCILYNDTHGGIEVTTSQVDGYSTSSITISSTTPTWTTESGGIIGTFQGWATSPSGQVQYQPGNSVSVGNTKLNLYAIWKLSIYYGSEISGANVSSSDSPYSGLSISANVNTAGDLDGVYYLTVGSEVSLSDASMMSNVSSITAGFGLREVSDMNSSYVSGKLSHTGTCTITWSDYSGATLHTTTIIVVGDDSDIIKATGITLTVTPGASNVGIHAELTPSNVLNKSVVFEKISGPDSVVVMENINSPYLDGVAWFPAGIGGYTTVPGSVVIRVTSSDGAVSKDITVYSHVVEFVTNGGECNPPVLSYIDGNITHTFDVSQVIPTHNQNLVFRGWSLN